MPLVGLSASTTEIGNKVSVLSTDQVLAFAMSRAVVVDGSALSDQKGRSVGRGLGIEALDVEVHRESDEPEVRRFLYWR